MAYVRETVQQQHQNQSSSLPIKLETAHDILQQSHKLFFDIPRIDRCLDLTDRRGGLSITSEWQQRHVNNFLLTRLCVKALMSKRQRGFGSPSVIFIDAGNCSDIYQCMNFARQYGMDIQKVSDSIIVSRPFNIHQLAGLLIDELDPSVVKQRFGAKLVVISDLLKMFSPQQDSQIDQEEALWLVKEIARALRKLSSHELVVVSMHEYPTAQYRRLLLSLFDNQIHIATTTTKEPGRLQVKVKSNFFDNRHDEERSSNSKSESSFVITERDLRIIPPR